jgi:competence protein ComEC
MQGSVATDPCIFYIFIQSNSLLTVLHKEIPFIRIGLPLCAGIITGLYIKPAIFLLVPATIIIVSGFCTSLLFNKTEANVIFGYTFTFSIYICGLLLYANEKSRISTLITEQTLFCCTLDDFPEEKENSYMLTVSLNSKITLNGYEDANGSMILYHRKDRPVPSFLPGDQLIIKCTPVEIVNRGNPYEFDYRFYMENHGIRYYAFTDNSSIITHIVAKKRKLVHRASIIREKIIDMYQERGITGEKLAVVAAITLGQKNLLDPEQKQNFIKAGVMHIMAVSGLHAVILSFFVFRLLFFLKRKSNLMRILITIFVLWSFAFVSGLTPSVMRATLMFSFLQAGNLMKRHVNAINSVLASAFILILIRPSIIFDTGFLLSYAAVIFILNFYQDFYLKLYFKNWFSDKIWQSATVTITAQAGTLPLTILLFNRFPTYFILTNIIIVPLASLLIIMGCLVLITFPVHTLSQLVASILNYITRVIEYLTEVVSSLPCSTVENIGMTRVESILLIFTIFIFSYFILKKRTFSITYPLLLMSLLLTAGTISEISTRTTNELIVFNTPGSSTIGIRTGKILNLFSDTTLDGPEVIKECASLGLKIKRNIINKSYSFIRAGDKHILISNTLDKNILRSITPDIVVLTGLHPEIDKDLSVTHNPQALIVTSGVYAGFKTPQQPFFMSIDTVHLVRKSGAYIIRI